MESSSHTEANSDQPSSQTVLKLQRLKLEESLLMKNLMKLQENPYCSGTLNPDRNGYTQKLINDFMRVKNLYENIKANATHEDNLKVLDIEDMKKDVLELENKMKGFKSFLQSELTLLKHSERDLIEELSENAALEGKLKRINVICKPYKDFVDSPVKRIIKSPFIHPEIQEFQDFLQHSKNPYGGWIRYNHNVFVQCWQKFYSGMEFLNCESLDKLSNYYQFIEDVLKKISGISKEEVVEHSKWYMRFLYLKRNQQLALDKWKAKRNVIKSKNSNNQRSVYKGKSITARAEKSNNSNKDLVVKNTLQGLSGKDSFESQALNVIVNLSLNGNYQMSGSSSADSTLSSSTFLTPKETSSKTKFSNKIHEAFKETSRVSTFSNPTEQWIRRSSNVKEDQRVKNQRTFSLDEISKLRIPSWRIDLK